MRLSSLLVLLPVALTASYVIPQDTPDGVYRTYLDESGNEVHERIGDGVPIGNAVALRDIVTPQFSNEKRQRIWDTACGCGIGLDHGSTDAAVQDLKNQIGPNNRNQNDINYYSIRGGVVAFSCLDDAWWTTTESGYLTNAYSTITARCGWYIAGTAELSPDGAAEPSVVGYMRYTNGLDFCRNAWASNRASC
ncbi:hypothetical protein EKO04_005159 [Ascochyta lentis]|uniref:Uncharacterized protein n=1 Tax=Ascochyta lentis TaxID=205686 RepID=A0A8H7J4X9_9PLEO|nr:hypothetical protein EKO04_005159 [Ascochyta lentis]